MRNEVFWKHLPLHFVIMLSLGYLFFFFLLRAYCNLPELTRRYLLYYVQVRDNIVFVNTWLETLWRLERSKNTHFPSPKKYWILVLRCTQQKSAVQVWLAPSSGIGLKRYKSKYVRTFARFKGCSPHQPYRTDTYFGKCWSVSSSAEPKMLTQNLIHAWSIEITSWISIHYTPSP